MKKIISVIIISIMLACACACTSGSGSSHGATATDITSEQLQEIIDQASSDGK